MVTALEAARDFNKWLAQKHANARGTESAFALNFAQLTAEIDRFRQERYRTFSSNDVPEVGEIEREVRKLWGIKSAASRKKNALRKQRADDKARQLDLF